MRWYYGDNRPSSWRKYDSHTLGPEEIGEETKKIIRKIKRPK